MKKQRPLISTCLAIIAALAILTPPALGQAEWHTYSAKFVCGRQDRFQVGEANVAATVGGRYRTVVNIHNPHYLKDPTGLPVPADFFKKAVLALPQEEMPLPPTCRQPESLPADRSLAVNCRNIKRLFTLSGIAVPRPFEGFLVIEVPPQASGQFAPQLDVVAVYTASQSRSDDGAQTIDVEEVLPKIMIGAPGPNPCPPD